MSRFLSSIASFVSWHRRAVGALLAGLAVLAVAQWLAAPEGATVSVVTVAADVPAGRALTPADVALTKLPTAAVPDGALLAPDEAVGEVAAVSLAKGTILHPNLLATARSGAPGRAVVPIRLPDPELRQLLRPGDRVTLIVTAAETAEVLTGDARISALPEPSPSSGLSIGSSAAGLILVEVAVAEAPAVAALGQSGQLSIALGGA